MRILHAVHHLAGAGIQEVQHAVAGGGDVAVGPPRDALVALPRRQRQPGGEQYLGILVHMVPHIDVPHLRQGWANKRRGALEWEPLRQLKAAAHGTQKREATADGT